jgi:hypothetical protein
LPPFQVEEVRCVQIDLRSCQFRLSPRHGRVDAAYFRCIGEPRPFSGSFRSSEHLPRRFKVTQCRVKRCLRDDLFLEQLKLPVVGLLGKFEFSPGLRDRGERLVMGGIEQLDVLLGLREKRFLLIYDGLIRTRVQSEKHVALLQRYVGLHCDFDHDPLDSRSDRCRVEIEPSVCRQRMIVVHPEQQSAYDHNAADGGRRINSRHIWSIRGHIDDGPAKSGSS